MIPAGYSFNMDGSAIYQAMAVVFIAQATNTPLTITDQLVLLGVLSLTSKGVAGVAGAALVVLAGTLAAAGRVPVAGVVLVLGIHRFMGQAMAVTNTIGNSVATIVIGRSCGAGRREEAARRIECVRLKPDATATSAHANARSVSNRPFSTVSASSYPSHSLIAVA